MGAMDVMKPDRQVLPEGPPSWRNWKAFDDGSRALGGVEVKLYSDAWFHGESLDNGPYDFLNPVPHVSPLAGAYEWNPAVILRAAHYVRPSFQSISGTNDEHYHGGWLYDEVAALLSLILEARIVAGPVERDFGYGEDPLGRPRGYAASLLPVLPVRVDIPQMPALFGNRSLADLSVLRKYPLLNAEAASTLVKAARLYQQALWIADSAPETAWLFLVSAVEVAAGYWTHQTIDPVDQLRRRMPDIFEKLQNQTDKSILSELANRLAPLMGATVKFNKFCKTFKPEPPENRPLWCRFDYGSKPYAAAIEQVYRYRSRALHGGIPFPFPMCLPPSRTGDGTDFVEERPGGLGATARGGTWIAEDLPMLLHVFAHIARGALLNWWESIPLVKDATAAAATDAAA